MRRISAPYRVNTAAAWVASLVWSCSTLPFALLLLVFPDGRPRWAWTRALAWILVAYTAASALSLALSASTVADGVPAWYRNPLAVPGATAAYSFIVGIEPITLLPAVGALLVRWWRARGEERRQIAAFAMAGLLTVGVTVAAAWADLATVGLLIAWPLFALSTAVIVLRRRLYGIDTLLSRTVVGAALAGFVVLGYLGLVTALGALIGRGTLTAIAATAVIAFAFQPVERAVQAAVRRLVHGARPAPQQVLSAFAQRAGAVADDEAVLTDLAALVAAGVGATNAVISLRLGDQLRPPPLDGPLVAVRDGGERVGAVSVVLHAGAESTPSDEALLADVGALAAPVLRALRLRAELRERNAQLAASRARLATAATQERRRLERDLHDGAQQRLIALKLRLGVAARATRRAAEGRDTDAGEAAHAVDAALRDADTAIDELRDLVHGIYPAVLDSEGLAAALRAQARNAALPVNLRNDLPAGMRYPRDVEAAAYFCCLEAVQNATKHANASRIDVHLHGDPARLDFTVTDDGVGFTVGEQVGRGLHNLADRTGALGGEVTVTSRPGAGTTVSGWLPSR
jgi:signal transduction histidine kinase